DVEQQRGDQARVGRCVLVQRYAAGMGADASVDVKPAGGQAQRDSPTGAGRGSCDHYVGILAHAQARQSGARNRTGSPVTMSYAPNTSGSSAAECLRKWWPHMNSGPLRV